ncbi:MAG TPA: hypothetical protein VGJ32_07970 [Solirubrobacteraceae bacterium]
MDLSHLTRTRVRAAVALAVLAGLLASAQLASARAHISRASTERAVRVKVVKIYRAYTRAKLVQVKCKRNSASRYGCYYIVPLPTKAKTKILLGNVDVRYRHGRARMSFSRPRCLGSGCSTKKKG